MIIPDPIIFTKPLHIWLGLVALILLITQILIGAKVIKVPFSVHTKTLWKILIIVALIHAFYGFERYFLK
jgi:hypothetical protein